MVGCGDSDLGQKSKDECPLCGRSYEKKFSKTEFRRFKVRSDASICKAEKHGESSKTVYIHLPKRSVGEILS